MSFDPKAGTHTHGNGLFLGEASKAAYEPATIAGWLQRNGFGAAAVAGFDVSGVSGFVASDAAFVLLVFTGTNSLEDWGINLKARPVADAAGLPGKVHRGFAAALDKVWASEVKPKLGGPRPLWVAGHSLGGALAVLAAARWAIVDGQPVQGLYTYGQPRV
ncbi:MAG TPA: hypothetical protein DEH78_26650, partial [Solibacterales bacterium]|nr:hypothetical protein [Bryobacterales bacterium]